MNASSTFHALSEWCELTPPPEQQLPPVFSDKSYHSSQREPNLIILPSWRWAYWSWTFFFFLFFSPLSVWMPMFLDGSVGVHITQLVIKWKSVPPISSSHTINYLYRSWPICRHPVYFTVQFMCCVCHSCPVLSLSLCVPHICYNERQEREPWLQGLTWEPTLLSLHYIAYSGLSLY